MLRDALTEMGVRLPDLVAAFWGGVTSVFFLRNVTPWQALSSFMVGLAVGTYVGSAVARGTGWPPEFCAFVSGLGGMAIAQGIIEAARKGRLFRFPGGTGDDGP